MVVYVVFLFEKVLGWVPCIIYIITCLINLYELALLFHNCYIKYHDPDRVRVKKLIIFDVKFLFIYLGRYILW